jgi:predicted phage tail protein
VEAYKEVLEDHNRAVDDHNGAVETRSKAVEALLANIEDLHHFHENLGRLKKRIRVRIKREKSKPDHYLSKENKSQSRIKVIWICSTTWLSAFFPVQKLND